MKHTQSLCLNNRFRQIYAKGKSQVAQSLVVYCMRSRQRDQSQLGITVSPKLGGAVVRNKCRRKIREAYRLNEEKMLCGWDIVIVARTRATSAHFKTIEKDMLYCFKKLSLLAGELHEKAAAETH